MRILINFSALKAGGGQNVAMNFLLGWSRSKERFPPFIFLVARNSQPHKYLIKNGINSYIVAPRNPVLRVLFEYFVCPRHFSRLKVELIYSYFGYGLFRTRILQVCGSAVSNIYYPEVDFWAPYPASVRLKMRLVDQYRKWGVKQAAAVIFENEDLRIRAEKLYGIRRTAYIKPSVNFDFDAEPYCLPISIAPSTKIALFLCGWQMNKNVMLIPELAQKARQAGVDLHIILTAPLDGSKLHTRFIDDVRQRGVEDMISITGDIPKPKLPALYRQVDCVLLLSKLESFSNNIIESWYFRKPLIVSSEPWSRAICGDSAFYVSRSSISDVVRAISLVTGDVRISNELIHKGVERLSEYPTIEERINQEVEYLRHVASNT